MDPNRRGSPPGPHASPVLRTEPISPGFFFTPDVEHEIVKLEGVISARVLSNGSAIEEVHVIASPDRVPKKLVRDIESLLLVRFGIRIDHRKIGIVQLGRDARQTPEAVRPRIQRVTKTETETGSNVCVQLGQGDQVVVGEGPVLPGESDLPASCRALLSAVDKLLNVSDAVALRDVTVVTLNGQPVVVVLLNWLLEEEFLSLVGATAVQGNLMEAAARATFDALNRKLVRAGWGSRAATSR